MDIRALFSDKLKLLAYGGSVGLHIVVGAILISATIRSPITEARAPVAIQIISVPVSDATEEEVEETSTEAEEPTPESEPETGPEPEPDPEQILDPLPEIANNEPAPTLSADEAPVSVVEPTAEPVETDLIPETELAPLPEDDVANPETSTPFVQSIPLGDSFRLPTAEERAAEAARIRELLARPTAEWLEGIDLSARSAPVIDIYNYGEAVTLRQKFVRLERCLALQVPLPKICNTEEGRQLQAFVNAQGELLREAGYFAGIEADVAALELLAGNNLDRLVSVYQDYLNSGLAAPTGGVGLTVRSSSEADEILKSERPGTDCHLGSASGFC